VKKVVVLVQYLAGQKVAMMEHMSVEWKVGSLVVLLVKRLVESTVNLLVDKKVVKKDVASAERLVAKKVEM
jgi:hypothetical protein